LGAKTSKNVYSFSFVSIQQSFSLKQSAFLFDAQRHHHRRAFVARAAHSSCSRNSCTSIGTQPRRCHGGFHAAPSPRRLYHGRRRFDRIGNVRRTVALLKLISCTAAWFIFSLILLKSNFKIDTFISVITEMLSLPSRFVLAQFLHAPSRSPDYRSPGRPKYTPIQNHQFIAHESFRKRYWARSFAGFDSFTRYT
jgi:hypothetical protein